MPEQGKFALIGDQDDVVSLKVRSLIARVKTQADLRVGRVVGYCKRGTPV